MKSGRMPPALPEDFEKDLALKSFTNGSTDNPLVARLYRAAFEQVVVLLAPCRSVPLALESRRRAVALTCTWPSLSYLFF